jgi:hypothetical protein
VNMCFISVANQKKSGHAEGVPYLDPRYWGFETLFEPLGSVSHD